MGKVNYALVHSRIDENIRVLEKTIARIDVKLERIRAKGDEAKAERLVGRRERLVNKIQSARRHKERVEEERLAE